MLGDDPDPSVMTERVGFGAGSDVRARGATSWQERLGGHGQEGSENPIGLGTVKGGKGNSATTNGLRVL